MIFRRPTIFRVLLVSLAVAACLQSVYADPPQFRSDLDLQPRYLSPFPGFETHFIASITPEEYVSLMKLSRQAPYDMTYDFPDYSVSYMRRLERNQSMIPVNSSLDNFVQRRLAMSEDEMEYNTTRESLLKDQKEKAGGLFQFTIPIPSRAFESIFGEGGAGLRVSGYRRISFTGRSSWSDKPQTAFYRQSKFPTLQMEQDYRFDIEGTIGSKISVKVSQDSRNDIPLANRLILRYKGTEDDILQSVEAGNTTLNLPATQFLAYSTRVQGLFGLKATAQLADLSITAIASQEKGSTESVAISTAGATGSTKSVIRDIDFKERMIYDLGRLPLRRAQSDKIPEPDKYDFVFRDTANGIAGDSITRLVVYVDDFSGDATERFTRPVGNCYIDPTDTLSDDPDGVYKTVGYFETIDATNYYYQPTQFYIQFLQSFITNDDIVAVYMEVLRRREGGVTWVDTVGNITSDTMKLKLIKPQAYNDVNHHVWEYQWRNVYYLGSRNIDLRDFELEIYKGTPVNNQEVDGSDLNHNEQGVKYLQILGLDRGDDNGTGDPDGEIDRYVYIDQSLGLLIFPSRHPFDDSLPFTYDGNGQPVVLTDSIPEIYINQNRSTLSTASGYYMAVSSRASGSSIIQLNATNIIENSEVVMNGNDRLTKGKDYDIDYDFGRLTLLRDDLTNINSNLSITFERAPFYSLDRKTLLGTRLEYVPSRDFNIGTTILYKSEKSTNRKPKVGEETSKMLVWDMDMDYSFRNPLFTTFADAIPFVSASAESYMKVSAEVAQSRPNPNVDGEVFIDDFEGSKDSYSLGIPRKTWRFASRPVGVDTSVSERAHVAWLNPIEGVPVTEIWSRQIGTGEASTANVLEIHYKPVDHKFVANPEQNVIDSLTVPIEPEKSWAGFMRNISQGAATQLQEAQLLEIRLRTGGSKNGNFPGLMHIDLGRISEDIDGDGVLDAENRDPAQILSDEEDVGLDGIPDQNEVGYDPGNGITDPAGDNFDINDVWRINGTEKNSLDPDGGNRADTEDPDMNGIQVANSYFSYKVNLSDTASDKSYYVEGTMNDDGWETIRIPLRDPDAIDTIVGDASWNNIFYARIWFDSATTMNITANGYQVEIASIDLISTTWADSFYVADSVRSGEAKFDVAVINNEIDNRYDPPVAGYYDPQLNKTESEQSLLLTYYNLNSQVAVFTPDSGIVLAADTGLAVRKFYRSMNFMGYGRLQAYVWGDATTANDSVMYFFRMGSDKDAYYEYRTILRPGWDAGNFIDIDFSEITALKARLLEDRQKGIDSSLTRVSEDGKYAVKIKRYGQDPTLTRMQYFSMGVINLTADRQVTGEVWVDELRLTDVRDDVGMAGRVAISGNMSDLGNYSLSYSTQDAYYRGVSSATKGGAADNLGSGQTRTNYSFSSSIKMDKFFPRSLELQLPVRISWSQSVQDPLLRTGTDIIVPEELRKIEKSVTVTRSIGVSEKFSKKTRNPVFTLFLNRLSSSFNYNTTKGHSATQPMYFREQYDAKSTFDMSPGRPPSIMPLSWTSFLKVPFGVPKTRLYLYPTRLNFNGNLSGSYSKSINQSGADPVTRKLDFTGTMDMAFKVFDNLTGAYSVRTDRDLRDPNTVNIVLNPKEFRLGVERTYSQNSSLNYSPSLFKFITHKFSYSARYSDTYRSSGRDTTFVHSATSTLSEDVTLTFNHQALLGSNRSRRAPPRGARQRGGDNKPEQKSTSFGVFGLMLRGIRTISDAIDPVSGKIGTSRTLSLPGLSGKATAPFRFGLTDDPGVDLVPTSGGIVRQSKTITKTLTASSGVSLFAGIGVDANYSRNSRESFDTQPLRTVSVGWPDLSLDLRSVRGLWYLGKLINALSPSSRYSKTTETKKYTASVGPYEKRVREAFSPLVSFSINPLRSMRTTGRYERTVSMTTQYTESTGEIRNMNRQTSETYSAGWSYRFSSPSGVKLPILGRIKFESNLNITLDVSIRRSHDETANQTSNLVFTTSSERTNLTISPTASYSFSSTVKGGLSARWQDDKDKQRRETRHTRELGFWVELQF